MESKFAHGARAVKMTAAATVLSLAVAMPAAAESVKIGYLTTLSGPGGLLGKQMRQAVELAHAHLDGKIGGLESEIIFGDDQRKPDVAKQVVNKMIKKDQVNFVSGIIWSNIMMAVHKSVTRKVLLVGSNAGPSPIAGAQCSENFFSTSWQNDQTPEAMGKYLKDQGINNLYVMAPNYQAGKDMVAGVKRYYDGKIVGEVFTKLGQQDYQVEISQLRAASPEAVFIFLPGGMGINFLKQYQQAGLRDTIPLYNVFSTDNLTLKPQGEAALGALHTSTWSADIDNPVNNKFVADFEAEYGSTPAFYAAQAYDSIMLIDYAVRTVGNATDMDALRTAMRSGEAPNTRGKIAFNNNHFPIQNYYMREVVKLDDGKLGIRITNTVFENYKDSYAKDCPLKW